VNQVVAELRPWNGAQIEAEAHETPSKLPPTRAIDHSPPFGCLDTSTPPPKPTATHRPTDGHESPVSDPALVATSLHDETDPAGLVEVNTSPRSSTATHNLLTDTRPPSKH
jgi:hypothetical protein